MSEHAKRLAPFFGKRCVIEGAETYESGLYFYAFDATREKALAKAAVEQAIGSWEALEDIGVRSDDVVVFGATVDADLNPQPRPAAPPRHARALPRADRLRDAPADSEEERTGLSRRASSSSS